MIKVKDVTVGLGGIAKDTKARMVDFKATQEYVDGKVTDKVVGTTYTCLAERNGFEKFTVKVADTKSVITQEQLETTDEAIYIEFEGFEGKFYYNSRLQDWALTCKAKSAKLVTPKK